MKVFEKRNTIQLLKFKIAYILIKRLFSPITELRSSVSLRLLYKKASNINLTKQFFSVVKIFEKRYTIQFTQIIQISFLFLHLEEEIHEKLFTQGRPCLVEISFQIDDHRFIGEWCRSCYVFPNSWKGEETVCGVSKKAQSHFGNQWRGFVTQIQEWDKPSFLQKSIKLLKRNVRVYLQFNNTYKFIGMVL